MFTKPILRTVLTSQAFLKELVVCIKPFSGLLYRIHKTQKKNLCDTNENSVKIANTVLFYDIPASHLSQGRGFLTLLWRAGPKPQPRDPVVLAESFTTTHKAPWCRSAVDHQPLFDRAAVCAPEFLPSFI